MATWIPCPCCREFWCSRHGLHTYDCSCPPIEEWGDDDPDPYGAISPMTANRTLAERLRRMLDERGCSITEAASLAGMTKQHLHSILSGRNPNPGFLLIEKIVNAAGGTLGELFADED